MRRATTLLTTTPAPRPQPPNTSMRAHLTQPRATPAPQHAHATTRAQQAAGGEIRLDHGTIVCDDHHDDLLKASRGLSLHPTKSSARGPSNNTITTIMSPRTRRDHARHHPAWRQAAARSPTGVSLNNRHVPRPQPRHGDRPSRTRAVRG